MDGPLKDELFGLEYSAILKYSTNSSFELLSSSKKDVVCLVLGLPRMHLGLLILGSEEVMTIADTESSPLYCF